MLETYLVLLYDSLDVVHEHFLVLWQQGQHHSQPIENQQETFGQWSLVCPKHTQTYTSLRPDGDTVTFFTELLFCVFSDICE